MAGTRFGWLSAPRSGLSCLVGDGRPRAGRPGLCQRGPLGLGCDGVKRWVQMRQRNVDRQIAPMNRGGPPECGGFPDRAALADRWLIRDRSRGLDRTRRREPRHRQGGAKVSVHKPRPESLAETRRRQGRSQRSSPFSVAPASQANSRDGTVHCVTEPLRLARVPPRSAISVAL